MGEGNCARIPRRHLLRLGALSLGTAALAGSLAAPAYADPTGSGADGAPAGDLRFRRRFAASSPAGTPVQTSYNGWPVGTPAAAISVKSFTIPGTSIPLEVKSGVVATILLYVAGRFNVDVQPLFADQVGGYEYRRNVNNPKVWSNHASGTAIDLNSELHPNGKKGTFTAGQVAAIRSILTFCGDVIFWGGDYSGTPDEMHFEINVPPGDPALDALVSRIGDATAQPPVVSLRASINDRYVTAENRGSEALIANRTVIGRWEQFDLISRGGDNVALRAHANNQFVCADAAGSSPLIANRGAVGPWETFTLIHNSDGTVSLNAVANGRYVTAENGGSQSLIANRNAIGPWEKFDLIDD